MQPPSSSRRLPAGKQPSPSQEPLIVYLLRVLAGVLALIILPVSLMFLLEKVFHIQLQDADRSLVHLMLGAFFLTYLAILGFKTPFNLIQQWRKDTEQRLRTMLGNGEASREDGPNAP